MLEKIASIIVDFICPKCGFRFKQSSRLRHVCPNCKG